MAKLLMLLEGGIPAGKEAFFKSYQSLTQVADYVNSGDSCLIYVWLMAGRRGTHNTVSMGYPG